jgi:hypothetical protein
LILYILELRPDLLDELCGKLYLIVTKIRQNNFKKLVIGSAADFSHTSRFVIDLSALKDSTGEVMEAIASFKTMYADTRVVVIADREPEDSALFPRLFEIGVYDIVRDLGGDGLKKCLTTGVTKEEAGEILITGYSSPPLPDGGERHGGSVVSAIISVLGGQYSSALQDAAESAAWDKAGDIAEGLLGDVGEGIVGGANQVKDGAELIKLLAESNSRRQAQLAARYAGVNARAVLDKFYRDLTDFINQNNPDKG